MINLQPGSIYLKLMRSIIESFGIKITTIRLRMIAYLFGV
jgi:hypothetical protein